MRVEEFNALPPHEAADTVRPCADVDSWIEALVAGRPYDGVAGLIALADAQARTWTGAEVEHALADHPRIGERPSADGASAAMSRREQGGVAIDSVLRERLRRGNAAYEERFGRVFLVRAAGRDAEEILALLEQRLANDPETELAVTADQLREIALLRLEGLFS
ncbi:MULTISPECIES: 2-oxo-4-hydroxy-4-carboxy-5-ureidoimidazoline decarboxylase [unclassified Nocardioides]|uniref:2-oxo-4-hydroxy-4-carboxy-5-ureidoimidazoline decarboxylase n=1 Tax=unclassified Nocardioides TaxID=2615069 RepID=UPI000056FD33|nr:MULTISPECIES: 2-oxo-4-hydroxy-4-carboxy-5-ureidoimidazoline decarboxylase [unclassified Nocardioides]ABL80660.1 putative urate oxidase, N-terminal [Nocardioides sp. JS614]